MAVPDLSVEVAGIKFRNPVLTAAGPPSRDGEALKAAARGGAGGLVAKTISVKPAEVPRPCMIVVDRGKSEFSARLVLDNRVVTTATSYVIIPRGMLNAELWSDLPYQRWLEREYAIAKETGLPLIASIGYTAEDLSFLGPKVEKAGVDGIEFSLHYVGVDYRPILEIAKALREAVDIPIFPKLSPHIMNLQEFAKELEKIGVDGIVAVNSLGPCLSIDIETGKPLLGGKGGFGWLSGPAIKPLGIRVVAEVAKAVNIPVIGVGGVMNGLDAIEYFMAGASAVQICTGAILEGQTIYGRVAREIGEWLKSHGYDSVEDIRGIALKHLPEEPLRFHSVPPTVDEKLCKLCGLCEKSCIYEAIKLPKEASGAKRPPVVDEERCYGCGTCVSICPTRALSFEEV
jgi:dihydroorotate dehydrogenase subfamily 1